MTPEHSQRSAQARRRALTRLGLDAGLLTGLSIAIGAWAPEIIALWGAPVRLLYLGAGLGAAMLALLGGLAGWLSARSDSPAVSGPVWLAASLLITLFIGRWPYAGRSLAVWLADPRFWGRTLYPFDEAGQVRLLLTGFFIVLGLTLLGLAQPFRLESVYGAMASPVRMSARAWFLLTLPMPLALGLGLIADNIIHLDLRRALWQVNDAVQVVQTYTGDLFTLGLERGVNYGAAAGVRGLMTLQYDLMLGEIDLGTAATIIVMTRFDNGAWIQCRVLAGQLSHCSDASPPYQRGLPALLSGESLEDCPACRLRIETQWRDWLLDRRARLGAAPRARPLAQWGPDALLRLEAASGDYAVDCWLTGLGPVRVDRCVEVP